MAEAKAKKKLHEVSLRWGKANVTPDMVFSIYKNPEKYTTERQISLLKQMFRNHILDYDRFESQFETDVRKNKKSSYDAFVIFLNNITLQPKLQNAAKPPTSTKSVSLDSKLNTKSEIESPALSSTRLDHNNLPEVVVSEVYFIPSLFLFYSLNDN